MASITTPLPEHTYVPGNTNRIRFSFISGSRPDWSALSAGDADVFGVRFQLYGDNDRTSIIVSADQTTGGGAAGPELSDAFEVYNSAVTVTVPGFDDLVIGGPNDPLNTGSVDPTEPYNWEPGTNARYGTSTDLADWVDAFNVAYALDGTLRATLILDDGEVSTRTYFHVVKGGYRVNKFYKGSTEVTSLRAGTKQL